MNNIKRLLLSGKNYWWAVWIGGFGLLFSTACGLVTPSLLMRFTAGLQAPGGVAMDTLLIYAAILIGAHMDLPGPVTGIGERELLYLADKLCRRGRITRLDDTARALTEKFASDPGARAAAMPRIERAAEILDLLARRYGAGYDEIVGTEK